MSITGGRRAGSEQPEEEIEITEGTNFISVKKTKETGRKATCYGFE
jgi:hypothetical protein